MLHFNKKAFKALTFAFILSIIPSIASAAVSTYTPAPGPLTLGDSYAPMFPGGPTGIQRGLIMKALINDPEFRNDQAALYLFTKTNWNGQLPRYQDIVESLKTSLNNLDSIAVLEAFEKIIMKIVHYEHYMYYTEGKWTNMFFAGIQKPSLSWLTLSTSADISQLMQELKQLATIAKRHSLAFSFRLHNKANSYLYWKTRMLKTLATLGAAGGAYYYRDDLKNALNSAVTTGTDLANAAASTATNAINATSDFGRSIYSTGANWADSAYSAGAGLANSTSDLARSAYATGADWTNAAYSAGANTLNAASDLGSSIYSTGADWTNYLGTYVPTYYSANQ